MSAIPEKFHITKHMPSARATEYFSRLVPVNLTTAIESPSLTQERLFQTIKIMVPIEQ